MDPISLIGIVAAILTTSAFLPQVIKAHVSRETKDLSDETSASLNAAIEKFKSMFNVQGAA